MKIYVVTSGSYSDYRLVGLFSSEKNARDYMEAFPIRYDGYNDIDEVTVDDSIAELQAGLRVYRVYMGLDGGPVTFRYVVGNTTTYHVESVDSAGPFDISGSVEPRKTPDGVRYFTATVWAKDKQHALKIVNEMRIQAIAEGRTE